MLRAFYPLAVYETPGEGGGAAAPAAASTPASPPASEPSPSPVPASSTPEVPPTLDETTSFALEAFDAMNADEVDLPDADPEPREVSAPVETSAPTTPPVSAPAPTGNATPPVPGTAAATPQVSEPVVAPSAPAAVALQQSQQPQVPQGFEQIAEELTKQQEVFVEKLAEANYKLSEKDLEELQTDPGKLISRLLAQAQVSTTASVMKVFAQQLPVVVNGLMQARQRNQEAENSFWAANSHLDRNKHRGVVAETMKTIRALNPNMDSATFIKQVGIYAGMSAGVAPSIAAASPQAQQVVRTPGPVVRNTNGAGAFAPVGANAAPPSAHPAPAQNEWERMAALIEADESGAFDN